MFRGIIGVMKEVFLLTEQDLGEFSERVATILSEMHTASSTKKAFVILLTGDLGAGKTTFTKSLAGVLGIESHTVHSPTFILKKEYKGTHAKFKKLIHVDAYRFNSPEEAKVLRLDEDLKDEGALIVIEWPSKMTYVRPDMEIDFKVQDESVREITISYEER